MLSSWQPPSLPLLLFISVGNDVSIWAVQEPREFFGFELDLLMALVIGSDLVTSSIREEGSADVFLSGTLGIEKGPEEDSPSIIGGGGVLR